MTTSATPPRFEPHAMVAGDNVQWTRVFDDYDPVNYTLSYALMPTSGDRIQIEAADQGDHKTFLVSVAGSTTETWTPGFYLWQAYITDDSSNRTTLYKGRVTIQPDFATATVADYRTTISITVQNLYAVIQGKATSDQQAYTIRGRSLSRMQPKELLDWLDFYEELLDREIRREAIQQGRPNKGKLRARFTDPAGMPIPEYVWQRGQW